MCLGLGICVLVQPFDGHDTDIAVAQLLVALVHVAMAVLGLYSSTCIA